MAEETVTRKLTAIFYTDVAGYSRLTGADEEATHRALSASLDAITATIEGHGGRVLHYACDASGSSGSTVRIVGSWGSSRFKQFTDRCQALYSFLKVKIWNIQLCD